MSEDNSKNVFALCPMWCNTLKINPLQHLFFAQNDPRGTFALIFVQKNFFRKNNGEKVLYRDFFGENIFQKMAIMENFW